MSSLDVGDTLMVARRVGRGGRSHHACCSLSDSRLCYFKVWLTLCEVDVIPAVIVGSGVLG
jgi:hypothetical protein